MRTFLVAIACSISVFTANVALAQSLEETADSLESAIGDLQSALDDLEEIQGSADEDISGVLRSVRDARRTMRSAAISLLIASIDPRRPKEFQRKMNALNILEPNLFNTPKLPGGKP